MDPLTKALDVLDGIITLAGKLLDAADPATKAQIATQQAEIMKKTLDLIEKIQDKLQALKGNS